MRAAVALLLLAILPGLLLPAGFAWRLCTCAAPARAGAAKACCPREREGTPPCCRHHDGGEAKRGNAPVARDGRCGCTWIKTPEHKPDPKPPETAPPHAAPVPTAVVAIVRPTPPRARTWRATDAIAYHPPPDRTRNLPLLL